MTTGSDLFGVKRTEYLTLLVNCPHFKTIIVNSSSRNIQSKTYFTAFQSHDLRLQLHF